jgi:phosphoribosylanthranilate isomerase
VVVEKSKIQNPKSKNTKIKICGITNLADALASVRAGCDALGFIFYKKSPRYINPIKAKEVIAHLPKAIIKIGVFVNAKEKDIVKIARLCRLDMLQFHGDESSKFCERFNRYKVIKVFRVKNRIDPEKLKAYKTFAYLFDTFVPSKIGGTGRVFNWKALDNLGKLKQKLFLSGGLNQENICQAIKIVNPDWVDVSSYLEIKPGKKSHKKIKRFIKKVKKNK